MSDTFFEDVFETNLGPQERSILAFIYRAENVTAADIARLIYGTPSAAAQMRVRIRLQQIRAKLVDTGWTIPKRPHRDRGGFYRLEKTDGK